ncbi:hypothetical protein [Tenacibaculum sp. nBUS_03]|uniref:hypothetical protein n=1 Tax=Tenacibaculum sp. nBUS_03 TaxID=3395320 RepID=UPI003EBDEF4C
MKKVLYIISIFTFISCQTEIDKIKNSDSIEECIGNVTRHINQCFEDSNQIEIDEKADYDFENNILIVYKGKSTTDYFQKWEIPLAELDPNRIEIKKEGISIKKITVFTKNNEPKIRYFKDGKKESNPFQNNYHLKDYCFDKKNGIEIFFESYKRAILLAQNKKSEL